MELIIILLLIFILNELNTRYFNVPTITDSLNKDKYKLRKLMTDTELYFYNILKELEGELDVKIQPQVNLRTILNRQRKGYASELYRNIDFGIFSSDYQELLLLIEINDSTHRQYKRRKRDKKVNEILSQVNMVPMRFYTNKPNTKQYVKNRVKNSLIEKLEINKNIEKEKVISK